MRKNQTSETQTAKPQKTNFFKTHKKIVLTAVIIIAVMIPIIVTVIVPGIRKQRVRNYLDGKIFIDKGERITSVYMFKGNKVAREKWYDKNEIDGDISKFVEYKISAPLLEEKMTLNVKRLNGFDKIATVKIINGNVIIREDWIHVTKDEYGAKRKMQLCEHAFGEFETIKEATCSAKGEEKRVCEKCGYEETVKTDLLPHNYVNGSCTVCGIKEPSTDNLGGSLNSSASSSEDPVVVDWLTPDYWYTSNDIDVLHIQNGVVVNATLRNNGNVFFTYYSVCKKCHIADSLPNMADAGWDTPVNKTYHCSHCGTNTIVRFMLR